MSNNDERKFLTFREKCCKSILRKMKIKKGKEGVKKY